MTTVSKIWARAIPVYIVYLLFSFGDVTLASKDLPIYSVTNTSGPSCSKHR